MNERRRTIRRIITRAAIFLLFGALINIAVAWGLALTVPTGFPYPRDYYIPLFDFQSPYYGYTFLRWRSTRFVRVQLRSWSDGSDYQWESISNGPNSVEELIPHWGSSYLQVPRLSDPSGNWVQPLSWDTQTLKAVEAHGWPYLAVWGGISTQWKSSANTTATPLTWSVYGSIPLSMQSGKQGSGTIYPSPQYPRFLPYIPLWPGFAINTIFFTAILWLLFCLFIITPRWLRRRHRITHGQCGACGYDLRASKDTCPECGAAIPQKKSADYEDFAVRDE